jgi:hypothetical protein
MLCWFLLSMNTVTDFVISKKKNFIDFLDELGLFIEEKPICTKKKIPSPAVCPEKFGSPFYPFRST